MQIYITGTRSKKLITELNQAAEFFALQLMDPRMVRNLNVDIEIVDKLDVNGECISEDDTKNPRWFTINLKRKPPNGEDIIQTLAHEMVHVKQYAKNEMSKQFRVARGGLKIGTKWHGEWWDPKKKEDSYWDAPWEIIAYGMEVGLIHKWYTRHDPKMAWYVGTGA